MPLTIDTSDFARFVQRMQTELDPSNGGAAKNALDAASNTYHAAMRLRFLNASLGDGTWQQLAPSTVREHARIGDDLPHVLHMFGPLELSLRRGEVNHVLDESGDSVIEGTEDPKARFHQDGGPRLPQRQILVVPDSETLDDMKAAEVAVLRSGMANQSAPLDLSDSDLSSIFDIDII